jgi:hypothetical protein
VPKSSFALGERRACENITVTNCYLATDCFCFKLGTESGGDFRYIAVSNCVFDSKIPERRAQAGIALETVDGANIVGVVVSNITMNRVQAPVFLRLGNRGRDMPAPSPGTLRDVIISDIVATNASATSSITGVPGARVRGVTLSNISVSFEAVPLAPAAGEQVPEVIAKYPVAAMFGPLPAYGLYCRHADGLVLRNLRFTLPNARPPGTAPASALICDDVTGLRLDGLWSSPVPASVPVVDLADVRGALIQGAVAPADAATYLRVRGSTSRDVSVLSNDLSGARVPVECAGDVRRDAVRMDRGRVRRAVTR